LRELKPPEARGSKFRHQVLRTGRLQGPTADRQTLNQGTILCIHVSLTF